MKNMPSVMSEMPNGVKLPIPGKTMQKGGPSASVTGADVDSSAAAPGFPALFHRLFQDSLRVHEQTGIRPASLSADGQDQGDTAGKTQLGTQDGEKGLLPLVGTKSRSGKGRLISAPGVKGKAGKKISAEGFLSAGSTIAVSSQHIPMVVNNQEPAPLSPQETAESHAGPDRQGNLRRHLQNGSGKTPDHIGSNRRRTGEYSTVPGEKGGLSKTTAIGETEGKGKMEQVGDVDASARRIQSAGTMQDQEIGGASGDAPLLAAFDEGSGRNTRSGQEVMTSPLLNASAVAADSAAQPSSGSGTGSVAPSSGRQLHASEKRDDQLRVGHRSTGEYAAVPEEKDGSISRAASVEASEAAKNGFPDDDGDVTGIGHGADRRDDGVQTRQAADSPLLSPHRQDLGRGAQAVPGENTSLRSNAAAVPTRDAAPPSAGSDDAGGVLSAGLLQNLSREMDTPVRSGRRQSGEYSAVSGEKHRPRKHSATAEMGGNGKAAHGDDVEASHRGPYLAETRYNEETSGQPDGPPPLALFKADLSERLQRAVVGEEPSILAPASAVPAVDAASISVGSDTGEGALSPGRQAQLVAEVIDAARPLVQQDGGRVRISLSPPSLGDLEIDVRVNKEGVELFVVANNSDVQQALCSNVDQLRKALVDQGLNMDRFQVVVGERSDGQQGRDPRQDGMSNGNREAWNEKGYLPGGNGNTENDEMGNSARSNPRPSVGMINLFI